MRKQVLLWVAADTPLSPLERLNGTPRVCWHIATSPFQCFKSTEKRNTPLMKPCPRGTFTQAVPTHLPLGDAGHRQVPDVGCLSPPSVSRRIAAQLPSLHVLHLWIDGQSILAKTSPMDGDLISIQSPMSTSWKIFTHKTVVAIGLKRDWKLAFLPLEVPLNACAFSQDGFLCITEIMQKLCSAPILFIGLILWHLMSCHAFVG